MKISKRSKYLLISLLILLNFILRIPSVPHEIGVDSFLMHVVANSISKFGIALWWVNLLSVFGFYTEYSYASAVPFTLSGISQCTGLEMELTIWLFCVTIGLFSAAAVYLLAGEISDDDRFKFLVAFVYSVSPAILYYSTWDTGARGLFIMLLPLFMYLLLKIRTSILKYSVLAFIVFMLLMATHHLISCTIPIISGYVVLVLSLFLYNKLKERIIFSKIAKDLANIAIILSFVAAFLYPFITGLFIEGEKWYWLDGMITTYVRYTGLLIVFIVGAFIYLSLKHNKSHGEWFFIFGLISITPLLYIQVYAYAIFPVFAAILIGVSLTNIAKASEQKKKYIFAIIIIISLLLSISFSGFYQHWRTGSKKYSGERPGIKDWFMREATYVGGLWIKDNINKNIFTKGVTFTRRIFAISEVPTLTGYEYCDMIHGFTTIDDVKITKNSPLSTEFYMDNPYVINYSEMSSRGEITISDQINILHGKEMASDYGKRTISKFDLSYVIDSGVTTVFIQSVQKKQHKIYDNGKIIIWPLE